jgi:predicted acyltransferase
LLLFTGLMLSTWMPINKQLWTASYTVFTGGLASIVFACCLWLIDVAGWKRYAKPFAVYGVNALAVYVLSGIFADIIGTVPVGEIALRAWMYSHWFQPVFAPENASLAFALAHVALFWAIAWFMYRRNWIVRV